ncbi:MAG: glycerophosphodiester phosphodiesterase family protein [Legionellaceae bacterium]|nr:glycerophosphodiester phosphodiesterase family protein [Legionellaceae bacterium]
MLYLIAHRGGSASSPENTFASIIDAKDKGAKCVEFDVMLTEDEQAILFHDESLERTTDGTGYVASCTLEYIKTLDAGSWFNQSFQNTQVPTLVEAIQLLTKLDLNANIELKPCGDTEVKTTKIALEIVKKYWPQNKPPPLISSFNYKCIELAQRDYPEYPRAILLDEWQEDCCEIAKRYGCVSINIAHNYLTRERVDQIKNAGFLVYSYTVNKAHMADDLREIGVDGIFSYYPRLLDNIAIDETVLSQNLLKLVKLELPTNDYTYNWANFRKVTLIGLPGVGTSTVLSDCSEIMRQKGLECNIQSMDEVIRRIMCRDDSESSEYSLQVEKGISIFLYAEESSDSWLELTKTNSSGRSPGYQDVGVIIICVDGKTADAIAREIFNQIAEIKFACSLRNNNFTQANRVLFTPETPEKDIDIKDGVAASSLL